MITITIELTRELCQLMNMKDQEFLKNEFNAFIKEFSEQNEIDPDDHIKAIERIAELPYNEKISLKYQNGQWDIVFEAESIGMVHSPFRKELRMNRQGKKVIQGIVASYPELEKTI